MIHSMTGYGRAEGIVGNKKVTIQIKSLNSKQADIAIKAPSLFRDQELNFRKEILARLKRGKIEMSLAFEAVEKESSYSVNETAFNSYFNQLSELSKKYQLDNNILLSSILKMPEVLIPQEETADESDNQAVSNLLDKALDAIVNFRADEGQSLEVDLKNNINQINRLLTKALVYEKERIEIIRNRILSNLEDLQQNEKIDHDRFEQEMIYYLEKYDISEEKVRLKTHCDYFVSTIKGELGQGKKLGFISQEIGREINTLGSKANHAQMQQIVVQMKDQLEKIKEQVLNVL